MHPDWKLFLYYWIIGVIGTNTAVSYLFSNLLHPRSFLSQNPDTHSVSVRKQVFIKVWLFYLIPITCVIMFRINVDPSLGTVLLHLILIMGIIILFKDSLFLKLSFYFILVGLLFLIEFTAFFSTNICVRMLTGREILLIQMNSLDHTIDMVIMDLFYILFCFLFIYYSTIVLLKFENSIHFGHVTVLFTPGLFVSLGSGLILNKENSPQLHILLTAYILFDILCILLVLLNLRSIAARERKHEMLLKQTALVRQQLDYSNDIEEKYKNIRKRNHDIANQLQSLIWMIRNRHYPDASAYLEDLIEMNHINH